jgi:hypothetical protein
MSRNQCWSRNICTLRRPATLVVWLAALFASLLAQARQIGSLTDLEQLLNQRDIRRIDSLSANLPESILKNTVLWYEPRSLTQGGNVVHPRALFYGPYANLMFTMSDLPDQHGYQNIEVIEFSRQTHNYSFHEIIFDPDGRTKPVIERNSKECAVCHFGKPIWDTYPVWPGVFGTFAFHEENVDHARTIEENRWRQFLAKAEKNPRYAPLYPYLRADSARDRSLVNTKFSNYLTEQTFSRLSDRIKQNPHLPSMIEVISRIRQRRLELQSEDELMTAFEGLQIDEDLFHEVYESVHNRLGEYLDARFSRIENLFGNVDPYNSHVRSFDFIYDSHFDELVAMQYFFLSREMGIDLSEESTTFEKGTFAFLAPYGALRDIIADECEFDLQKKK